MPDLLCLPMELVRRMERVAARATYPANPDKDRDEALAVHKHLQDALDPPDGPNGLTTLNEEIRLRAAHGLALAEEIQTRRALDAYLYRSHVQTAKRIVANPLQPWWLRALGRWQLRIITARLAR